MKLKLILMTVLIPFLFNSCIEKKVYIKGSYPHLTTYDLNVSDFNLSYDSYSKLNDNLVIYVNKKYKKGFVILDQDDFSRLINNYVDYKQGYKTLDLEIREYNKDLE